MEIDRDVFLVLLGASIPQVGSILRQLITYWLNRRLTMLEQELQARREAAKLEKQRLAHDLESTNPEDLWRNLRSYETPSRGLLSKLDEIEVNLVKRLYEWFLGVHKD